MAMAVKTALGVETLTALADLGYYNGGELRACEADAITAYVPPVDHNQRLPAQGRFSREDFHYDPAADVYRCPGGKELRPIKGRKLDSARKWQIRYISRRASCRRRRGATASIVRNGAKDLCLSADRQLIGGHHRYVSCNEGAATDLERQA